MEFALDVGDFNPKFGISYSYGQIQVTSVNSRLHLLALSQTITHNDINY